MIEVTPLCGQICLGKQGENFARMICFNEPTTWKETFGEGKCELLHQRNGDAVPYPVVLEVEDGKVYWKFSAADTAFAGEGKCELHYIVNDVVVKSKIWVTSVIESLGEGRAEPPEPQKAWVDQVLTAAETVESATTHQPMIGENGNWYVWDADTMTYKDSGTTAKGEKGADGVDGKDGSKGDKGDKGDQGEPGYTPEKGTDYWTEADKAEVHNYIGDLFNVNFGDVASALDSILAMQEALIGGGV